MGVFILKIIRYLRRLPSMDRPLKFTIAVMLQKTELSRFIVINRDGYRIRFFTHSAIARSMWVWHDRKSSEEQIIGHYLRAGDTIVDVGANIGTVALMAAAQVGPTGCVIAIEPHPRTFDYLAANCALNNCSNVRLLNYAVGSEKGLVSFSDISSDDQNRVTESGPVVVKLITLDDLLAEADIAQINVLKIDVEGFEKHVLLGAKHVLEHTQCVFIEMLEANLSLFNTNTAEIMALLRDAGYDIFLVNQHKNDVLAIKNGSDFSARASNLTLTALDRNFCCLQG